MLSKLKTIIKNYYLKKGFKTNRKIVVFESDDWGSVRSNKQGVEIIKQQFPDITLDNYQLLDTLEQKDDFESLFGVLKHFKDKNGNCPIFTLNYIMQNPKFDDEHTDIDLQNTYKQYGFVDYARVIGDGIENRYIKPQLHGLEHYDKKELLKDLDFNNVSKLGYDNQMIGLKQSCNFNGMDTFKSANIGDITLACKKFNDFFGFNSESFIFPCYVSNNQYEKELKENGVNIIQSGLFNYVPKENGYKTHLNYMGKKNKYGQVYLIRNCQFEPTKHHNKSNVVQDCLKQVDFAFQHNKPAVICTHRVNYVGGIDVDSRNTSLQLLNELLTTLTNKYKDIEFMSSDELGKLILERNNGRSL